MNCFLLLPRSSSVSMLLILALTSLRTGVRSADDPPLNVSSQHCDTPSASLLRHRCFERHTTSTRKLASINVRYRPLPIPRIA